MKGREKRLTFMLLGCMGLLFLVFLGMVIYPTYKDMSSKADEQTALKNQAEAQLKEAKSLDPDEVKAQLVNLKSRVPNSLELPNVINRITDLATGNNLLWLSGAPAQAASTTAATTDTTVTPSAAETTQAPQLDKYDFTIVVNGDINDFVSFMAGLTDKSIGRIIVINSLNLQFKPDLGPNVVEASLKLQIIGWKSGSSIDSQGCTQETLSGTSEVDTNDPKCNTTDVNKGE